MLGEKKASPTKIIMTISRSAVVGAGPAGLAVVSRILDTNPSAKIFWFDPSFAGGRLQKYSQVPSNTKVSLFLEYATSSPSLNHLIQNSLNSYPIADLKKLNQDKGCELVLAQKLCAFLINGIKQSYPDRVEFHSSWVQSINYNSTNDRYNITSFTNAIDDFDSPPNLDNLESQSTLVENLFLCTGAQPIPELQSKPHKCNGSIAKLLDLDVCLSPSILEKTVNENDTVVIVGSSHSAILCLKNLSELKSRPRIVNFYQSPLKYAVYMDGWILYDNTGLKQMAATWAKENLEEAENAAKIGIERIQVTAENEEQVYKSMMPTSSFICYAIGFKTRSLPKIVVDDVECQVTYNNKNGNLKFNGKEMSSAKGFGIAFPESVTDRQGNVETNVGMWKFIRYIRELI